MQHLGLGWVTHKEWEDLLLTSDWVWRYMRLVVKLTICMMVMSICCIYIDLIPTIMDDSHIHLGVWPTLIWWHLQSDTAEVNWLKGEGKFCRKADIADVDLASDKVDSRALDDLVRYPISHKGRGERCQCCVGWEPAILMFCLHGVPYMGWKSTWQMHMARPLSPSIAWKS